MLAKCNYRIEYSISFAPSKGVESAKKCRLLKKYPCSVLFRPKQKKLSLLSLEVWRNSIRDDLFPTYTHTHNIHTVQYYHHFVLQKLQFALKLKTEILKRSGANESYSKLRTYLERFLHLFTIYMIKRKRFQTDTFYYVLKDDHKVKTDSRFKVKENMFTLLSFPRPTKFVVFMCVWIIYVVVR